MHTVRPGGKKKKKPVHRIRARAAMMPQETNCAKKLNQMQSLVIRVRFYIFIAPLKKKNPSVSLSIYFLT